MPFYIYFCLHSISATFSWLFVSISSCWHFFFLPSIPYWTLIWVFFPLTFIKISLQVWDDFFFLPFIFRLISFLSQNFFLLLSNYCFTFNFFVKVFFHIIKCLTPFEMLRFRFVCVWLSVVVSFEEVAFHQLKCLSSHFLL